MLLGSLYKGGITAGLYPIPTPPYSGLSFKEVSERLLSIKLVGRCDSHSWDLPVPPAHGWLKIIKEALANFRERLGGLALEDLKPQPTGQ
jgi:hypothetical protein